MVKGGEKGAVKYLWDLRVYFYEAGSSHVTVQCGRTTLLQVMNNSRVCPSREGTEDSGQKCLLMVSTVFSGSSSKNKRPRSTPVIAKQTHKTATILKREGNKPYLHIYLRLFTKCVNSKFHFAISLGSDCKMVV